MAGPPARRASTTASTASRVQRRHRCLWHGWQSGRRGRRRHRHPGRRHERRRLRRGGELRPRRLEPRRRRIWQLHGIRRLRQLLGDRGLRERHGLRRQGLRGHPRSVRQRHHLRRPRLERQLGRLFHGQRPRRRGAQQVQRHLPDRPSPRPRQQDPQPLVRRGARDAQHLSGRSDPQRPRASHGAAAALLRGAQS